MRLFKTIAFVVLLVLHIMLAYWNDTSKIEFISSIETHIIGHSSEAHSNALNDPKTQDQ